MLLFDEQLSEELCDKLRGIYPQSARVREAGLGGASDDAVWEFARGRQLILVTKDEDFHRLALLRGAPPLLIWLRFGNCSTAEIADLLRRVGHQSIWRPARALHPRARMMQSRFGLPNC